MTVSTREPESIDAYTPVSFMEFGPVVGGDSAMVTSDGDSSYVEVQRYTVDIIGTITAGHTFSWTPTGPVPPDAVVTIEADWFTTGDGGFTVSFTHPTLGERSVGSFLTPPDVPSHAYGNPDTIAVSSVWVEDGEAFGPGVAWSVSPLMVLTTENSARITRLTMRIETVGSKHPHQIFQRGDGLGAGPSLVFKPGTRQSTGLVFGTY